MAAFAAACAPIAASSARAGGGSAASARTGPASWSAWPMGPSSRSALTRSRRSRSSTSRPARWPTRSPRPAARSTARSARTGRSPRDRGSDSTCRPASCRPRQVVAEAIAHRAQIDRLHVRRADGLPRVRPRHRPAGARCRAAQPVHHRRLRDARGGRPAGPGPRRRERRPEVVRRRLLSEGVRRAPGARPRVDRRHARRRDLARADDAGHPGPERRRRPDPRAGALDRRHARPGDAVARQPLLSRLPDARRAADARSTTLRRVADLGREAGLAHVYVGNAPELGLEDTHCAGCGRVLIERRGYEVALAARGRRELPGCGRMLAGRGLASPAPASRRSRGPCG